MLKEGFCFSVVAADEETRYVVNVCGHDSIGRPLFRSMVEAPDELVNERGLDNLIVPISVGSPHANADDPPKYVVDVAVNPSLILCCQKDHPLFEHFVTKLITLAIEWVHRECGVQLLGETAKFEGLCYHKPRMRVKEGISRDSFVKAAELLMSSLKKIEAETTPESIPAEINLSMGEVQQRSPLIKEVVGDPTIKRGFLLGNEGCLYRGGRSTEGTGKVYDSLAHIPESLRSKCKIIDTRAMGNSSLNSLKENFVAAPVAPHIAEFSWKLMSCDVTDSVVTIRLCTSKEIVGVSDVDLSASANCIDIDDFHYSLPCCIDIDGVRARYLKQQKTLVLKCPVLSNM